MRRKAAVLASVFTLVVAACSSSGATTAPATAAPTGATTAAPATAGTPTKITIWAHQGQDNEVTVTKAAVTAFNALGTGITAEITFIPEGDYQKKLDTTAVGDLPDVVEVGGENVGDLVYNKKLQPISSLVSADVVKNQISSTIAEGTVGGKLYAVAQFDSGLALYGNKSMLTAAGITSYPTKWQDAWTAAQFTDVLTKLAAKATGGKAIDLKEDYAGTWPGYAFLPVVNSAGFLPVKGGKADGNLNAPAVVTAMKTVASWKKYVDADADGKAFTDKRVGLSWVGHWVYTDYSKALGADLVVIPLPDFGAGTKSGQGSYTWAIGASTKKADAAAKFLEFLASDAQVKAMTDVNGAPPATKTATAASKLYAPGGPLELYAQQLAASCGGGDVDMTKACVDVPRTISAAWPVINTNFSKAFWNIYNGADAKTELDAAAKAIDQDNKDNNGYQ
jgi:multiple sugar transport system substrate-binding protein